MKPTLKDITRDSKIGVAGCGAMGLPMAYALVDGGFSVRGYDVRPTLEFGDFAPHMMPAAQDFSGAIDILISVVRDQGQTLDLYFDDQAIFCQPAYPKVCLLASTVSVRFLKQVRDRLPDDVVFMDIPMSGAPIAAEESRLAFMVGADETTAAPIAPLLAAMGRDIHYLGGPTKGMACKVLNNFVAASSVTAVRQVMSEAAAFGIPADTLLRVMESSSGATWFGDNFDKISWANEEYAPNNTIGIVEKDVNALLSSLKDTAENAPENAYMKAIRDQLSALPASPKKTS